MKYTVKELAKLSGVSVRTLHWYDEIGLLKPAYYSAKGYRHYEEEQLQLLKQILFFKELGFALKDIQKMLSQSDFDKLMAIHMHKATLEDNVNRSRALIETIDKAYAKIAVLKQEERDIHIANYYGTVAEDLIHSSKREFIILDSNEHENVETRGNEIYKALSICIDKELGPRSDEVQKLIHSHYQMTETFYYVSKDVYMGLAQLYCEHPGFRKFFDSHHPKLVEFIAEAMRVYVQNNLS